jgi:CelD/BcsL family acetyltransferase involved in cellulose biosynthesis
MSIVGTVRAELRSVTTLSATELDRWRELARVAVEPNPYFEPEFVLPAAAHVGGRGGALLVVDDGPGTAWAACLPVRLAAHFRKLPGPALMTWRHRYAYLGTPLMAPGTLVPAWGALLDFAAADPRAGYLGLEQLGDGGPVAAALGGALRGQRLRGFLYERVERAALTRREDGDYLNPELDSRRRRELRRQRRKLEEELGSPLRLRDRAHDPTAVEAFLALEAAGWKGREGTALRTAGDEAFFVESTAAFAAAGRLQLLALEADGRLVAMKCNLLADDEIFCFKIAYDEELAQFSPGVQLELENIGVFHATPGIARTDSCAAPENTMINRLWRGRRSVATVLVPGRRALGSPARIAIRAALQARRILRNDP